MKHYADIPEACVPVYTPKTFPDKVGLIFSIKLTNLHRSNFFQKSIRLEDQLPLLDHTSTVTVVQFSTYAISFIGCVYHKEPFYSVSTRQDPV